MVDYLNADTQTGADSEIFDLEIEAVRGRVKTLYERAEVAQAVIASSPVDNWEEAIGAVFNTFNELIGLTGHQPTVKLDAIVNYIKVADPRLIRGTISAGLSNAVVLGVAFEVIDDMEKELNRLRGEVEKREAA